MWNQWWLACACLLLCGRALCASHYGAEPPVVSQAFDEISARLAMIESYEATLSARSVDSIDGALITTGRIAQQPPYAFRRDVWVEEANGSIRRHELTVSDGSGGWHVVTAPNGAVVNASHWGVSAVEDMFFVMLPKSRAFMLSPDRTNTYTGVRQSILFDSCIRGTDTYVFSGHYRNTTPQYTDISRIAHAFGPVGMSNYLVDAVRLVVNDAGIPVEFARMNLLGQPVQLAVYSEVRANPRLPLGTFSYTPPPGAFVFDSDQARTFEPLRVGHPLLGKPAPTIAARDLCGTNAVITPGTAPIVLTFFTSWSSNCHAYLTMIEALQKRHAGHGVMFPCISDEKSDVGVKRLYVTKKLTLPIYLDEGHRCTKAYSIQYVPKTLVINRAGIVVDAFEGNAPGIEQALDEAVRQCIP